MRSIFAGYVDGIDVLLEDARDLLVPDFSDVEEFDNEFDYARKQFLDKSRRYFDSVEKKLNNAYVLNDKNGILAIKGELEENENKLLGLNVKEWTNNIFQNLDTTESGKYFTLNSIFFLENMCKTYSELLNMNFPVMGEAKRYLKNIPTKEFLDIIKRDNLAGPISEIYESGWHGKNPAEVPDFDRLHTLGLAFLNAGGKVLLSNKAAHIYNTCLNKHSVR